MRFEYITDEDMRIEEASQNFNGDTSIEIIEDISELFQE
jgi:hypothetical protein